MMHIYQRTEEIWRQQRTLQIYTFRIDIHNSDGWDGQAVLGSYFCNFTALTINV